MASTPMVQLPQQAGPEGRSVFSVGLGDDYKPTSEMDSVFSIQVNDIPHIAHFIAQLLFIQRPYVGVMRQAIWKSFLGMPTGSRVFRETYAMRDKLTNAGARCMAAVHCAAIQFLKERMMRSSHTSRAQTSNIVNGNCPFGDECIYYFYALFFERILTKLGSSDSRIYHYHTDHINGMTKMVPERINAPGCMCTYNHRPTEGMTRLVEMLEEALPAHFKTMVYLHMNGRPTNLTDREVLSSDIYSRSLIDGTMETTIGNGVSRIGTFMGQAIIANLENASERFLFFPADRTVIFPQAFHDRLIEEQKSFCAKFAALVESRVEYIEERSELEGTVKRVSLVDMVTQQPYYNVFNFLDALGIEPREAASEHPVLSFYENFRRKLADERTIFDKETEKRAEEKRLSAEPKSKVDAWLGEVHGSIASPPSAPSATASAPWPFNLQRPKWPENALAPRFISEAFLREKGFRFDEWANLSTDSARSGYVYSCILTLLQEYLPNVDEDVRDGIAHSAWSKLNAYQLFDDGAVYGFIVAHLEH